MRHKYTKELLEPVIKESTTWTGVCRKLGVAPMTGSQTHIKSRAIKFGIDFSHFVGQASNRGRVFGPKRPLSYYLKKSGPSVKSNDLKLRLFKDKIKERRCEECRLNSWLGEPIPLELDHINREHTDNRLSNLRILCPNCHARRGTLLKRS